MRSKQLSAKRKLLSITLVAILVLSLCLMVVSSAAAQTDQAASKLAAANLAVGQAFNGVLGAEKAGANVTGLLVQLNVAEGFLAQAENSYRTGDSTQRSRGPGRQRASGCAANHSRRPKCQASRRSFRPERLLGNHRVHRSWFSGVCHCFALCLEPSQAELHQEFVEGKT
jgi:uncharacterized protein YdbL (DUF1318 family)